MFGMYPNTARFVLKSIEFPMRLGVIECYNSLIYMINPKLSQQRFWHCHENGLIKTIQTIPHNLYVSFKLASLYCGLRLILVYPNP